MPTLGEGPSNSTSTADLDEETDEEAERALALRTSLDAFGEVEEGAVDASIDDDVALIPDPDESELGQNEIPLASKRRHSAFRLPTVKGGRREKDGRENEKEAIIGVARFRHEPHELETHLTDILSMWAGERPLKGVELQDTKRCHHCEFLDGCEWRLIKGQESLRNFHEDIKDRETSSAVELQHGQETGGRETQEDSEDEFWSQIPDIPEDLDW
ncbi:hypothetical protein L7F22_057679 [Adiantum nelumboides]|nr:hypothetical protein [Adiantum nelumboides]